ncbi:hypothetical protein TWF718_009004 [Orbilia javanica]|uniref:Uncharacterized protein n=1 Tax=Orbilia javanica TaxID=47235 RepID=A0AAN8RM71_9PEZI
MDRLGRILKKIKKMQRPTRRNNRRPVETNKTIDEGNRGSGIIERELEDRQQEGTGLDFKVDGEHWVLRNYVTAAADVLAGYRKWSDLALDLVKTDLE